jgi:23S rRNA (adenine1618-N6)-methyltransferase
VLDIGMGASCIYPLIGACEYGWRFVGSEVDPVAFQCARTLVASNRAVSGLIDCRMQTLPAACFKGVVRRRELFDASMCNPPFHASAEEAAAGNARKRRNLGGQGNAPAVRNFGGKPGELWCAGGELAFVRRMIEQSVEVARQIRWFTTLVAQRDHLPRLSQSLKDVGAVDVKVLEMAQGQKQSRILAWTFRAP